MHSFFADEMALRIVRGSYFFGSRFCCFNTLLITDNWSVVSRIEKLLEKPSLSISRRRIRTHIEWKVETHMRSPVPWPSRPSIRLRISRAALFVNVIARILEG